MYNPIIQSECVLPRRSLQQLHETVQILLRQHSLENFIYLWFKITTCSVLIMIISKSEKIWKESAVALFKVRGLEL